MENESKLTQKIDLGLAKILVLANIINRKTDMCCFSEDVAHCEQIEIKLTESKINYTKTPVTFKVSYSIDKNYSWNTDSENRLKDCERCIEFLENTLTEKNIDYSQLYAVTEKIITSYEI